MSTTLDLQEIEHKVQRSFYQDGLMEILVGFYLMMMGLMVQGTMSAAFSALLLFAYKPAWEGLKRRFIYPRIGYVKFRPVENVDSEGFKRSVITLAIIAVASPFISILILGAGPGWTFWTRRFLPFFMGFITAIGPSVAAKRLRVYRWYVFSVLCVIAGLAVPYLGLESIYEPIGIQFMAIGGVALVTGLVMFVYFLVKYPVQVEMEVPDGG